MSRLSDLNANGALNRNRNDTILGNDPYNNYNDPPGLGL